jgi:hypothetical protein
MALVNVGNEYRDNDVLTPIQDSDKRHRLHVLSCNAYHQQYHVDGTLQLLSNILS